jgi:hypothetical protein
MKSYIVYVDGFARTIIQAASHNAAEKKAKNKFPDKQVSVQYTEI